ncbi:uncharacterized protein LOC120359652 [Solenopsis invicta]|uniref:uncharacterized protein LOC120359652 n=1 Tax=Solenopsis invicta TaxID=13686 RepID=UPI00193D4908|nr:uncharacterized protein LOC120359652 [Solenopsis invicta]
MRRAREAIVLGDILPQGGKGLRVRRAQTGGLLLEIPGEDSRPAAERLASEMRRVAGGPDVRISCPLRRVGISGFDESVAPEEVATAVADSGECFVADLRVGRVVRSRRGLGSVIVQCPVTAAARLARAGSLTLGWVAARVEVLKAPPQRCFRCLAQGHTQHRCPGGVDRARCCFNCGSEGHTQAECASRPFCPKCASKGKAPNHRPGSEKCVRVPPAARPGKRAPPPPQREEGGVSEEDRPPTPPPPTPPGAQAVDGGVSEGPVANIDMEETPPVAEASADKAFVTGVIEISSESSGASGLRTSPPTKKRCEALDSPSAAHLPQAKVVLEPLPLPQREKRVGRDSSTVGGHIRVEVTHNDRVSVVSLQIKKQLFKFIYMPYIRWSINHRQQEIRGILQNYLRDDVLRSTIVHLHRASQN